MMINFWFFAVIFGVLFLLGKAVWQDSKSFENWRWKRNIRIKNLKGWQENKTTLWEKLPALSKTYIIIASIVFIPLIILFFIFYFQIIFFLFGKESGEIREIAFAFFGTISGLAGLFGIYLAILRSNTTERQTITAEEGLITERINKATEGLGKKDDKEPVIEVRLGALYALERIAQDSIRDHVKIMEILCAYIRHNSPFHDKTDSQKKLREDIQAAIKIIGRRGNGSEGRKRLEQERNESYTVDLKYCNLRGADLYRAHLVDADFSGSNISHANIGLANLKTARISNAKLNFANLSWANLNGTHLDLANLSSADLTYAKMRGANLNNANLKDARLNYVNIHYARLYNTKMDDTETYKTYAYACDFSKCNNLTQYQLDNMFCGNETEISKKLTRPKHWPNDDLLWKDFVKIYEKWKDSTP